MKKLYGVLIFAGMMFLMDGCSKKDKIDNCSSLSQSVLDAASVFSSNGNATNCQAYKTAIQNYINDCSVMTSAERETWNSTLNLLNCSK